MACSTPEVNRQEKAFDLPAYFKLETERLQSKQLMVQKTVSVNGKQAVYSSDSVRWEQEFALPASLDLNKPAWIGKYRTERSTVDGITVLRYIPIVENIPLQLAEVRLDGSGKLVAAEGYRTESSLITETSVHWWYYPDSLYRIQGSERLRGMEENRYSVEGRF